MKLKHLIVILLSAGLFSHCSKDENSTSEPDIEGQPKPEDPIVPEEPDTIVYFEAIIGDYLNTDIGDHYLIIHDNNGNLIDYKPFEGNETVVFEADLESIADDFTVTYFYVYTLSGKAPFTLNSYTNVPKGSRWRIGINDPSPSNSDFSLTKTGAFDVNITGFSLAPSMYVISNSNGNGKGNGAYTITNTYNNYWLFEKNVELFENNEYYITLLNGFGETKFYHIQEAKNEEIYSLDYDQFSSFDSTISLLLPVTAEVALNLKGYPELINKLSDSGFNFYNGPNLIVGRGLHAETELGYFGDKFASLYFSLTSSLGQYTYSFEQYDSHLIEDVSMPQAPSFEVINPSIFDFDFSTDFQYSRKTNTWSYLANLNDSNPRSTFWNVHSPLNSTARIGNLPADLINRYQDMKISELEHKNIVFYRQSTSYNDFLDIEFADTNGQNLSFYTTEFFKFDF